MDKTYLAAEVEGGLEVTEQGRSGKHGQGADLTPDPRYRRAYRTELGIAFQGDSRELLASDTIEPNSVDLIVTSPPFALTRKKEYGNETADRYLEWFLTFVEPFKRALKGTGSIIIDIGGAYLPGRPQRSTYHFQLIVELANHFELCQEFYWYNPAKLPSPAEWVNIRRIRVKDAVNPVFWFAKDAAKAKANNARVLKRYSASMEALLKNGYQYRPRPSGHEITHKFTRRHTGAIPSNLLGFTEQPELFEGDPFEFQFPNLIAISNTASNDRYQRACLDHKIKAHPARFPLGLPAFFIEFLTEPGDVVCDPFAGSNTTGEAAESLGRRWVACDLDQENGLADSYVRASAFRFPQAKLEPGFDYRPRGNHKSHAEWATGVRASVENRQNDGISSADEVAQNGRGNTVRPVTESRT